jgi:hypothetical protein
MHRSGTSLLTELLQSCGLHLGCNHDAQGESFLFRDLNNHLLWSAGGDWTRPGPYLARSAEPGFLRSSVKATRRSLDAAFARDFVESGASSGGAGAASGVWGWKDPRTCLTHRVWSGLFPEARWIHIVRHPLDVAASLERRAHHFDQTKASDFADNLRLWNVYVNEAFALRAHGERYLEMRYEDFVDDPVVTLEHLCAFAGISPSPVQLEAAAARADSSRGTRGTTGDDQWHDALAELDAAVQAGYL